MTSVEDCRRNAIECGRLSEAAVEPRVKTLTDSIAKSWIRLANQMERLREVEPGLEDYLAKF
jgi:hypothetical protein